MDPHTFDRMIQRLAGALSRRSLVGGSLSAALLGAVRLGDDGLAKKRVRTERCLAVGERCPKRIKHGKKKVKHTCKDNCCTRFWVVSADGKRRCACREGGQPCTASTARQCCSGVCDGTVCAAGVAGRAGPPGPPGPTGPPPPPPPVCPAICPTCQTCNPGTGQCAVDPSENGEAGTGCAAPKVCCGGTCCGDPVHACTDAGACATCADVCAANCDFCYHLAEGRTICGDGGSTSAQQCASSASCPGTHPFCVLSLTFRSAPEVTVPACSPVPAGAGCCYSIPPCT